MAELMTQGKPSTNHGLKPVDKCPHFPHPLTKELINHQLVWIVQ